MTTATKTKCFACDRKLGKSPRQVVTSDGAQIVEVGRECYAKIEAGWEQGYQPPKGGPRLYLVGKQPNVNDADFTTQVLA